MVLVTLLLLLFFLVQGGTNKDKTLCPFCCFANKKFVVTLSK